MNIVPMIFLGVLCLLMAVMYIVFNNKSGWQGLLVRGLAVVSCIVFSLVSSTTKSINNAFPLFTIVGLSVLVLSEALKVAGIADEKSNLITFGVLNSSAFTIIAFGGLALSEFNIFALLGGIFFGVAAGLIVCAIKKYKTIERVVIEIISFISFGFILGFGLMSLMTSTHIASAVCVFISGILLIANRFVGLFVKENKITKYIIPALYIVALGVIALSVCLY